MQNIRIVIGANFGDEGKGLMTDRFCLEAKSPVLNVRFNGGAQAGHTVVRDTQRHIYSHIGAGSYNKGAETYLSSFFFTNPVSFNTEFNKLVQQGVPLRIHVSKQSRVVTPYDMMFNRLLESARGSERHGSCGCGVWEALNRNKDAEDSQLTVGDLLMSDYKLALKLRIIRDEYYATKLVNANLTVDPTQGYAQDWYDDAMVAYFIQRCRTFLECVQLVEDEQAFLRKYENIVYEGAQGLLLDWGNRSYMPHLTASYTGLNYVSQLLPVESEGAKIEVCYVSRPYFTRHGAGRFETEVTGKAQLRHLVQDSTNVYNEWQEHFRWGFFDVPLYAASIKKDLEYIQARKDYTVSLAFTHLNTTENKIITPEVDITVADLLSMVDIMNVNGVYYSGDMDCRKAFKYIVL